MSKLCIINTIKTKIKGNSTSYIERENEIIIPVSNKFTLAQTRAIAIDKVKKINKEYLSEKFGDVVSLNTSYTDGTGINIHPSKRLVDAYEVKEGNKTLEEVNSGRDLNYFNGDVALYEQEQKDFENEANLMRFSDLRQELRVQEGKINFKNNIINGFDILSENSVIDKEISQQQAKTIFNKKDKTIQDKKDLSIYFANYFLNSVYDKEGLLHLGYTRFSRYGITPPKLLIVKDNGRKNPFFQYNNVVIIGLKQLEKFINSLKTPSFEKFENLINIVAQEEIIHLYADYLLDYQDINNIYNEMTEKDINQIKKIYGNASIQKENIVHEYVRMVVQQRVFGRTTEYETFTLSNAIMSFFENLLEELNDFLNRIIGSTNTQKAIEDVINFTKGNFSKELDEKIINRLFDKGQILEANLNVLNNFQEEQEELDKIVKQTNNIEENEITASEIKEGVEKLFEENPDFSSQIYEALGFNNLRKEYSNIIIDQVWKRLANEGITNADSLIGTRETINNKDFNKFWSAVKDVDIQNVIKFFESEKQKALDSYSKYKGEFDPTTGTFTSNDTSFFDNKIKDLNTLLQQKQQAIQLYSSYLQTTNNPTIEGFKQWNNKQQQINELFESNPELANQIYEALGFKQGNVISSNYLFEQIIKNPENKELKKIAELLNRSNIKNRQVLLKDYDSISPTHGQAIGFIEDKKIATNVAVTDFEYLSKITTNEFDKEFFKNQSFQETLLHEELHRYTSYLLQVYNHYFEQTKNENDALKELKNYFENVLDKPNLEKEIEFIKEYNILYKIYQENGGTFNNREFITYGLTNPQEIKKLKNIKVGKETLLNRMIKVLFNLFSTPTLYDALYDTFSNYYLNFDSSKYKEFTDTVKLKLTPLPKNSFSITSQQKQQAISKFQEYINTTGRQDIEGFKKFIQGKQFQELTEKENIVSESNNYYQIKNIFNSVSELESKLKSLNKTVNTLGSEKKINETLKKAGLESELRKQFLQLLKENPSLKSLKLSEVLSSYLKEFVKESDKQYYKAIDEPLSEELEDVLINYFDKFHIRRKELDNLKEKFGVDSVGVFDVLAKTIYYSKNRNLLTLPEEYGHVFVELLGSISNKKADNPLFKYLFNNIESWDGYQRVYRDYKNKYVTAEGNTDIYKIKKEAIGQAIGIALVRNYKVQKGDVGFWAKVQETIEYILNLIKGIDYVSLNTTVDSIAKDILSKNYKKLDRLNKDTSNYNLLSYSETIKTQNKIDGGKALNFMQWFSKKGMIITGSLSYRFQGNVYRPEIDALHDIDNIVPSDVHELNLNKSNFLNKEQLEKDKIYRKLISEGNYKEAKQYKVQGNLKLELNNVLEQVKILQEFKEEFPDTEFLYSFYNQKANAYYVTINAIWSENQELKDRFKHYTGSFNDRLSKFTKEELQQIYLFDFFLRPETTENYKQIKDEEFGLNLAHFNYSFYEKLNMMGRPKDAYDYQMWDYFDEKNILAPDFSDRLTYFQLNQSEKNKQFQKLTAEEKAKTIEQLFNEDESLANSIYEALGFNQEFNTKGISIKFNDGSWNIIKLNNKRIGQFKFIDNGEKGILSLSIQIDEDYQNKGYGQIVHIMAADLAKKEYDKNLYSDYQNSKQEIQLLESLAKKGYVEKTGNIGTESKEFPDTFNTTERAFRIKTSNEIKNITPQQKQQATFMFSEFLDVYLQDFNQVEKILKEEKIIDKKCS